MRQVLGVLFLVLLFALQSKGQFNEPCVDSSRISPFFQCNDPTFYPVCGCNWKTYRNGCSAFNVHGVNRNNYEGVCQNDVLFFNFFPNVVTYNFQFYLQFYGEETSTLEIRDAFGKLWFYQLIPRTHYFQSTLEVSRFRAGVYFISVRSGDFYQVKKFIRISE